MLKPVMHDPRWIEILLLAAGRFGESSQFQATRFVRAILESGSEYEDVLHRDLFLAARCLGDSVRVDRDLRGEIANRLCNLYFDSKSPKSLREDIRKIFALLGRAAVCDDLVEILLERLSVAESDMRYAAASALGSLGERAASKEVVVKLLGLLSDNVRPVRFWSAQALGAMGERAARGEVVTKLLGLLSASESYVRAGAADGLGAMGEHAAREEVVAKLLGLLSDRESYVRAEAARALRAMGECAAREEVVAKLLGLLSDREANVGVWAAQALGSLVSKVQPQLKPAFIKLVLPLSYAGNKWRGDKNYNKREAGYLALRNLMSAGFSETIEAA